MKTLLVTGISGFLGLEVAKYKQDEWNIVGIFHENTMNIENIKTIQCDLSEKFDYFKKIIIDIKPQAILHLAACSNPNDCEIEPSKSEKLNIELTIQLANICKKNNIYLLFTSTDLVFSGNEPPYNENSIPNPINVYGKHKLSAENYILQQNMKACIARLPLMYGINTPIDSFLKSWINKIYNDEEIYAFTDEYRSMTSGKSIVSGLFLFLNQEVNGIWHLGGKERISRYEFMNYVVKIFHLPHGNIIKTKQKDLFLSKKQAKRPSDLTLVSKKAYSIGYNPLSIEDSLTEMYNELYN